MINTISDLIEKLEDIKIAHGNIYVRTQTQVGVLVEVSLEPVALNIGNHETDIKMCLIKGYKE